MKLNVDEIRANYLSAFDHAFSEIAGIAPIKHREFSMSDAILAVKISHYQCGPAARLAQNWLLRKGVCAPDFLYLGGHYALKDRQLALLFDMETVTGSAHKLDMPIFRRGEIFSILKEDNPSFEDLITVFALELFNKRKWFFSNRNL